MASVRVNKKTSNIPNKSVCNQLQHMGWFITGRQHSWLKYKQADFKQTSINNLIDWEYYPPLNVSDRKVKRMIGDWKHGDTLPIITVIDINYLSYGYCLSDIISPYYNSLTESQQKVIEKQIFSRARKGKYLIIEGHHRYTGYRLLGFKVIPIIVLAPEYINTVQHI